MIQKIDRVKIPSRFFEPDNFLTSRMIFQRVLSLFVFLGLLTLVWKDSEVSILFKITFSILFGFAAGAAYQNLALVGHDGGHFSLHRNKLISARIGTAVSALVPMHFDTGFLLSHATHHRYTNTEKDPDLALFSKYRSLFSRIFLARFKASRHYFKTTISLATGKIGEDQIEASSLTAEELQGLARLNLLLSTLTYSIYVMLLLIVGKPFAVALAVSFTFAFMFSSIRPFLEHVDTGVDRQTNSRTWTGNFMEALFGGINYHQAHHLYPGVPAYRIREFHEWLVSNNYIDQEKAIKSSGWLQLFEVIKSQKSYGSN
jgi:fatty acid desaturase